MHDIGKVAIAHGYPGLFSLIVKEMVDGGWASPMRAAEEVLAGGADHTLAGGIIAGGIYPFPEQAEAPTKGLFAAEGPELDEDLEKRLQPFLSEFLLPQYEISLDDVIAVGRAIEPTVRKLVENLRSSA
ncbi:MAG TPA: hypothetical protein DIC52_01095 [Candidatus Latescibacteria bacterium]|nr:hypothetical protein [Candidatus Latescibacterota bacterium]